MSNHTRGEYLRPPDRVTEPDPRTEMFVQLDEETGERRPLSLDDYYEAAASVTLSGSVPEKIQVQFETAKNLYLYAWFVYRFFSIAEQHALTCLEYALRERYADEIPSDYVRAGRDPTLRPLLSYAVEKGDIRNEGFSIWHDHATARSRHRHLMEKIREMKERGLAEIAVDYDEAEILEADRNWEYVAILTDTMPRLRNNYAHGSSTVHNAVLHTMRLVAECINQIY